MAPSANWNSPTAPLFTRSHIASRFFSVCGTHAQPDSVTMYFSLGKRSNTPLINMWG